MVESKTCTKCNIEKPLQDFNRHKNGKYGRSPKCRECAKKYHQDNVKARKKAQSKYRKKTKDQRLAYDKKYRESLKDGKYYVYILPEEHYCGQTNSLVMRMANHKSKKRYVNDLDIVMSFNTRREALHLEQVFHSLGWYGKK